MSHGDRFLDSHICVMSYGDGSFDLHICASQGTCPRDSSLFDGKNRVEDFFELR